jgi:hypothetical protein
VGFELVLVSKVVVTSEDGDIEQVFLVFIV